MKSFDVIVHRKNGAYRAIATSLLNLTTEGKTRDEALHRMQEAIEDFFKSAEVVTVSVDVPALEYRPYATANDHLRDQTLYSYAEDEDMETRHVKEIYAERGREREERERELDLDEIRTRQRERRMEELKRRQLEDQDSLWAQESDEMKGNRSD
ncbi:MAG: type II toxin-antitoxin system HicB family antitoxin [Blastocatellia bacterium]